MHNCTNNIHVYCKVSEMWTMTMDEEMFIIITIMIVRYVSDHIVLHVENVQ